MGYERSSERLSFQPFRNVSMSSADLRIVYLHQWAPEVKVGEGDVGGETGFLNFSRAHSRLRPVRMGSQESGWSIDYPSPKFFFFLFSSIISHTISHRRVAHLPIHAVLPPQ
ncbi:hypothetical protein PTI98_009446 [Pleurotus ostreatus]|nr:hypothetical protein PTI98_009446 [Pleurotus ostreatus]